MVRRVVSDAYWFVSGVSYDEVAFRYEESESRLSL
jgi:hypothetical protein